MTGRSKIGKSRMYRVRLSLMHSQTWLHLGQTFSLGIYISNFLILSSSSTLNFTFGLLSFIAETKPFIIDISKLFGCVKISLEYVNNKINIRYRKYFLRLTVLHFYI